MTITTVAPFAARSFSGLNSTGRVAFAALLLASAATPALAQSQPAPEPVPAPAPAPSATNTGSTESTNQQNPSDQPAAPQADDVASPQAGATVANNARQGPQDQQVRQTGLGDIVVTATKRETNLQRTPIAISVANAQALRDRHAQSLLDLGDGAIPSLRVATFEARQSALTVGIRGIVPLDANQPAREQGVGVYLDGIYLGRQHGLNTALFDIDRIEVLKGPQGTLFGRNTEGGAVSIISRAPSGTFNVRGLVGVGNYNSYNGELHVDFPAFANIAIKADAVVQHQDATTKNPLKGEKGWNYYDRRGGRISARWSPFDGLTNDLAFDISRDANTPFYSQLLNYNPNGCVATAAAQPSSPNVIPGACVLPGTNFTGGLSGTVKPLLPGVQVEGNKRMKTADIGVPQQDSVDKTWGISNTLRWRVSPEIELRSITGYREVDATQWDNSGGAHRVPVVTLPALGATNPTTCTVAAPCAFSRYSLADLTQNQFSQEFQAVGTVGPVDYVAGLYYFQEHVEDDAATPNSNGIIALTTPVGGVNTVTGYRYVILDPCTGSGGFGSQPDCRSIDRASEVHSKSYAAYGQLTWNATDKLHLTAGGRYTHDVKKGVLHISRNINYDENPATAAANGYEPLDKKWNRFNPMATVAYDFSNSIHAYAKYSTGYRSGGASSRTANYQAFGPEDIKAYELGVKTDFFDHRARLNIAAYKMDRKNSQVDISTLQPTATGTFNNLVTINAPGITKIKGIEADLTVRPFENLQMSAAYAYTKTHIPPVPIVYTRSPLSGPLVPCTAPNQTCVDQQFYIVFTPKHAASGSIDYELPVGSNGTALRFHLDGNYASATQTFDQFATKADSSFIMNGRVALADISLGSRDSLLTLAVWSRNLLNEAHVYRRDPSNSLPAVQTGNVLVGNIGNVIGDYGNFNPPRTFGLEASFKFAPRKVVPFTPTPPPPPPLPATVTCESGTVVEAPGACPVAPPPPPPPPVTQGERGQ